MRGRSATILGVLALVLCTAFPDAQAASWRSQSGRHWTPYAAENDRARGSRSGGDRREVRPERRDPRQDRSRNSRMTPDERDQLRRDLERADRDIYRNRRR